MKKYLTAQQGFTLMELMIGMMLTLILMAGMLSILSINVTTWTLEKNRTSMQQTVRIAVDMIVREIRYAQDISLNSTQSLKITKVNGETNTFQLGGGLHGSTLYMIIDKTKAIPVGGISTNPITENVVTTLLFTPYPSENNVQAIAITLESTDKSTGAKQTIQTAGYPWNKH